jgi:hypothetical protein
MTALSDITRSAPASPRVCVTALDTATLLTRFGLAPHLVAHWVQDGTGRLVAVWREDIVPHRPSVARQSSIHAWEAPDGGRL